MSLHKLCIEHILYPAMERLRGNHVRKNLTMLKFTEKLSFQAQRETQMARLAALLRNCAEHVPAYRWQIDTNLAETDPMAALRKIPPLSKAEFQESAAAHMADDIPKEQCIPNQTGGSTGQPVHFFMTRSQVERYEAARWRGLSWYGITPGSRCLMVWGSPIELEQKARRCYLLRERLLKNRKILSAYELSEAQVSEYLKLLNRYRPEYLYGYATALSELARLLEPHKGEIKVRLKAVVSTSETLFPWQKELLERVFSCPVANEYGARDAGILAYSCPCGGLHLTAENAIVEALDPETLQPLPSGKSGLLAVTDLYNSVQPRLRYLLGDVGAISERKCPCGRTLPLLEVLEGREDALLVGPNGVLIHGNAVGQLIRRYSCVRQFQLVQHTPTRATLYLVMDKDEATLETISDAVSGLLPNVKLTIQLVPKIAPAASGKIRYAIREFAVKE